MGFIHLNDDILKDIECEFYETMLISADVLNLKILVFKD
jgi:hypothetical protein